MEKTLNRAKKIFLYVASFPALIFFQLWANASRPTETLIAASLAMLVYCVAIIIVAFRWDRPGYFDWAITTYFAVITGWLFLWPCAAGRFLDEYAATGIYACFFAASFFPPLFGMDPFTFYYAKKTTPPQLWNNPVFIKINKIMTLVWSGLFAAGIVMSLFPSLLMRTVIPTALILVFGIPFNKRFPDYYLKRLGLPTRAEQKQMALGTPTDSQASSSTRFAAASAWEAISQMPASFNAAQTPLPAYPPLSDLSSREKRISRHTSTSKTVSARLGIVLHENPISSYAPLPMYG